MNFKLIFVKLISIYFVTEVESKSYTKAINIDILSKSSLPSDPNSAIGGEVLLNANKYCLGKWFAQKGFLNSSQSKNSYYDFGGRDETHIRGPSAQAIGLAVSLATRLYNESAVGKSEKEALNLTVKLLSSLAYRHRSNSDGGWGNDWQTALWASYVGLGSWLLWPDLSLSDKTLVENMVIFEANRFLNYKVPYYQDRSLKVIYKGDTKAEENAWNAQILQVAIAMMPTHPNSKPWMRKNIELMLSSFARHSDLNRTNEINGRKLNEWINGSNVFENGTLVNHDRIHPDYISTVHFNLNSVIHSALAQQPVPEAAFWNSELLYSALVSLKWPNSDPNKVGNEIYARDSDGNPTGDIFYPKGDDWGTSRRMNFAELDSHIERFTDFGQRYNASQWSALHIEAQHKLQQRFTDGRTYGSAKEDNFPLREEWVSCLAAYNYLAHWIKHNISFKVTNSKLD